MSVVFSVITPVYNGALFIDHCYASLAEQTYTDWEWVVVDDGSEDGTREIVERIEDPRIKLLCYDQNRGRGYARMRALGIATGDWMVVWDADDLYFPDRLESIAQARREGYDFFCSYVVVVDSEMEIKGVRGFSMPAAEGLTQAFVHHTLGCRMDLARQIGYDPAHRAGEDASMILSLASSYRGFFFHDALTVYQEEWEIGIEKAIISNENQLQQLRAIYRCGKIATTWWGRWDRLARWRLKLAMLKAMQIVPDLYRYTVSWRSYGKLEDGWTLSAERLSAFARLIDMTKAPSAVGEIPSERL